MKRKIFIIAVIVICLSLTAYGTLAFFTAEDTAHNVITSGSVNIQLIEKHQTDDGALVEFPEDGLTGIMPGTDASKIVSVKNTGTGKAWIRIQVTTAINNPNNEELPTVIETKSGKKVDVMSFTVGTGWVEKDGWYYYTQPVDPEATTDTLFETVHFAAEMDNAYVACTAKLTVSAEAVQSANNGATWQDATGWPTT